MNYLHWNLNATLWLFLLIAIISYQLRIMYIKRIIAKDCESMQCYKQISIDMLNTLNRRYTCFEPHSFERFLDFVSSFEAVKYEVKAIEEKYYEYAYSKNAPKTLDLDFADFYDNYFKMHIHFKNTSFTYKINQEEK